MPSTSGTAGRSRRSLARLRTIPQREYCTLLALLLLFLTIVPEAGAQQKKQRRPRRPTSKPAASQPADPPEPTTPPTSAIERLERLKHKRENKLTRAELATLSGLDFSLAVGVADAERALGRVDAVGYQPLPLHDALPEKPERALQPDALREALRRRVRADLSQLPPDALSLKTRAELRELFPEAARWMGDDDYALVIDAPAQPVANWVTQRHCIIIRVRGRRATIIGGTLLEELLSQPPLSPGRG